MFPLLERVPAKFSAYGTRFKFDPAGGFDA
jgi:hypothetical protein